MFLRAILRLKLNVAVVSVRSSAGQNYQMRLLFL